MPNARNLLYPAVIKGPASHKHRLPHRRATALVRVLEHRGADVRLAVRLGTDANTQRQGGDAVARRRTDTNLQVCRAPAAT
jgi:hypothetical protein